MALALVTGSSTGIGLATSISLARAGHTVVAAMRNLERSGEVRKIAEQEKLPIHLAKIAVRQFDLGPAAAISIVYFLIILTLSFVFYNVMTRVGTGDRA